MPHPERVERATIFGQDSAIGPTDRHFHSELGILPILVRLLSLAEPQYQNVRFQNPAQNEHFYRLSCRAHSCTQTVPKSNFSSGLAVFPTGL